jgi:hypothetical protein
MLKEPLKAAEQPGGLIHLLSAPEGSLFWAAGLRHEIQSVTKQPEIDREYVGHCLSLLLRSRSWRLLQNANGSPFGSFIQFCCASRPQGLGLSRDELESLPID